jgi:hypothetical protein
MKSTALQLTPGFQGRYVEVVSVEQRERGVNLVVTKNLKSGELYTNKVLAGVFFDQEFDDEVIRKLSSVSSSARIRLFFGDTETGYDWGEESSTMGYVGHTTGDHKAPILVATDRSMCGGIISSSIVKITFASGGQLLWKHSNYQEPVFIIRERIDGKYDEGFPYHLSSEYTAAVFRQEQDGNFGSWANFRTKNEALNYIDFLTGKANSRAYKRPRKQEMEAVAQ